MKRLLWLFIVCLGFSQAQAQFKEFTIKPGDIRGGLFKEIQATELKLNGSMYSEELKFVNRFDLPGLENLKKLDLSGITKFEAEDGVSTEGDVGTVREMPELAEVILPEGGVVKRLLQYSFANNPKLSRINIPAGVLRVLARSFIDCSSLENIEFPASLTSIGGGSQPLFDNNVNLKSIMIHAAVPPPASDGKFGAFGNLDRDKVILYVPQGSLTAYEDAAGWGEFTNIKPIVIEQQTIENFNDITGNIGDMITLNATASSKNPVTYSIETGKESVATLDGNKVTIKGEGTVQLTAKVAGGGGFEPAEKVVTITVINLSWLEQVSIFVSGNTAKVVGPTAEVAKFTKLSVNDTDTPLTNGIGDLTGKTGELSLKFSTADGAEVIKLKITK